MAARALSSPLRTLFVSHDGSLFGAQHMLLALIEELDPSVITPVLATEPKSALARAAKGHAEVVDAGRLRHWVPTLNHLGGWRPARYGARTLRQLPASVAHLRRLIRHNGIELVYSNTVTIVEGALAAALESVPHVWHIHEPIDGNAELAPLLPLAVYRALIGRLSARVVFPARGVQAAYPGLEGRAQVVYNGIAVPAVRDRAALKRSLAARLGLEDEPPLVGIVASLSPRKDHETFLRMAAAVLAGEPRTRFVVAGHGHPARATQLHALARDLGLEQAVTFTGRWQGDISDILGALDVVVISSTQESFGLTAAEAMALETPVVATRCGGPEEIIDHGRDGWLVEVGDVSGLAQGVLDLLQDPDRAAAMGRAGRAAVLRRFDRRAYGRALQELILQTSAGGR